MSEITSLKQILSIAVSATLCRELWEGWNLEVQNFDIKTVECTEKFQ